MKAARPLVSIIIPTYNRAPLIGDALESILKQQYSNWECFVIDDGSDDNTEEIVRTFITQGHNIRFNKRDQLPKGAPTCRNIGLKLANGEYIQFLDSDDILLPNKLSAQIGLINEIGKVGIVHGSYQEIRFDGEKEKTVTSRGNSNPWLNFYSGIGITSANLFNKVAVESCNGWDENLKSGQEPDLMFRMYQEGCEVCFDENINTTIRVQKKGITGSDQSGNYLRYSHFVFRVFDYLLVQKLLNQEEKNQVLVKIFKTVRVIFRIDSTKGMKAYSKYFQNTPHAMPTSGSKVYDSLLKLFGFSSTERIFIWMKK